MTMTIRKFDSVLTRTYSVNPIDRLMHLLLTYAKELVLLPIRLVVDIPPAPRYNGFSLWPLPLYKGLFEIGPLEFMKPIMNVFGAATPERRRRTTTAAAAAPTQANPITALITGVDEGDWDSASGVIGCSFNVSGPASDEEGGGIDGGAVVGAGSGDGAGVGDGLGAGAGAGGNSHFLVMDTVVVTN
jgi:hypothetical protein